MRPQCLRRLWPGPERTAGCIVRARPNGIGANFMDGKDVARLNTQKHKISLVRQFFMNYPHISVFDNITSPSRVAGMAKWR